MPVRTLQTRNTIKQSPKRIPTTKPGLLRSRNTSRNGKEKTGQGHPISTNNPIGRSRSKGRNGTMSRSKLRIVDKSPRSGTGLDSPLSRQEAMTAHSARRSFNILSSVPGNNIAQATGSRITGPGGSAADMAGISFPMSVSADPSGGIMASESASSPSGSLGDTLAFNTAAIGSAPLTPGRNTGETTGMTLTMFMSIT